MTSCNRMCVIFSCLYANYRLTNKVICILKKKYWYKNEAFALRYKCLTHVTQGFLFTREVCYHGDGIGCFSNGSPYNNAKGHLPESPSHIQIEYLLYTRTNSHAPQLISKDASSIRSSNFNGHKKTKFIIHGYQDNGREQWLVTMAHAILAQVSQLPILNMIVFLKVGY